MTDKSSGENYHILRSGLTLLPEHYQAIEHLLADLILKLPARFVVLTDVSGQLVFTRGDLGRTNLVALGSLMAGDLAASQEIARLIGEYQDYQMILREGQTAHTFIIETGHYLVLLVQISKDIPLGWARLLIQKVAHQLAELVERPPAPYPPAEPEPILSETDDLPDLFKTALDDLWMG